MQPQVENAFPSRKLNSEIKPVKILLVEDNPGDVALIKEFLSSSVDFTLRHVSTLKETFAICAEELFDIILLDLGLPDSYGVETLKKILVFNTRSPIVIMTGFDDEDTAMESLRQGAQDYLVKNNLTGDNIIRSIKYGIERKKALDLLKNNARQFSLLSYTTSAINECEDVQSIFNVACNNLGKLLNMAGVITLKLDRHPRIFESGTGTFHRWAPDIEKNTGVDLKNLSVRKGFRNSHIMKTFYDGKLHEIENTSKRKRIISDAEKMSDNYEQMPFLYSVGFVRDKTIFGGSLILSYDEIGKDESNIIETFGNQVSLSLQRISIASELIESENKYRLLNKDLELKVKKRTHDLEASNYLLNQELIERHVIEEELRKREVSLKELNATKDKFFSIIAHDLKNPFTCLLGTTELLCEKLESMDGVKIRNLVQIIHDSARSGYTVLENLLIWSMSQTGLLTYNPEIINLKEVIIECVNYQKNFYPRKELNITTETCGEMNIYADRNMIATILRNLIDNAIKFTPNYGMVNINAKNNSEKISVSVRDSGIGIPDDIKKSLFRLDKKLTRPGTDKERGTGLGLKICKEFTDFLVGSLEIKSTVNKGSEIIFTIPLEKNSTSEAPGSLSYP